MRLSMAGRQAQAAAPEPASVGVEAERQQATTDGAVAECRTLCKVFIELHALLKGRTSDTPEPAVSVPRQKESSPAPTRAPPGSRIDHPKHNLSAVPEPAVSVPRQEDSSPAPTSMSRQD